MSKAILVMDMPETCSDCILCYDCMDCSAKPKKEFYFDFETFTDARMSWCPPIPAIGYVEPVGNMVSWEDESDVD